MSVNVRATGTGASLSAASGGDGAGGTAAITVQDGAALNASNFVGVDATGLGGTGGAASGDGLGGGASIGISGNGSTYTAGFTLRSEEHTSELQSLMRISYAVFCLKKKKN